MLISLNWLRDFVEVPHSVDPKELALQFTITTAEVEGVEHLTPNWQGLVAGRIESLAPVPGEAKLQKATVLTDRAHETLTTAPGLKVGDVVAFAPPGATVGGHTIGTKDPQGRAAEGMIVAGQAVGLMQIGANALFCPPGTAPGSPIDPAPFDDWIIEVDNKSITHRPDCWGHYGIAREVAAMLSLPLRPYDVTPEVQLACGLPAIAIEIDDPEKCPRYSGLLMKGLRAQPSPLWMQVRLAHCGMRPIDLIVDLTNYVMLELGQPMHAFDGEKVANIQVAAAGKGDTFKTLDGVSRKLTDDTLMIQCGRKNVAIAGVMGGAESEVSASTQTVLLESANFDAPTIRRAATAMGHRTEASARFEKSLDPANTVLGIARFHKLAESQLPGLTLASSLSDCYPRPRTPPVITLDCDYATRLIGQTVTPQRVTEILTKLAFNCGQDGSKVHVTPPSWRATKDISIEADVIEEVARFIGYNNIEPKLPTMTARHFEPSPDLALEHRTLDYLCVGGDYSEVFNYIWYEDDWCRRLGFDTGDCITLMNPAAEGCARLRRTLVPGLLAMADRNRHHFARFSLCEVGSVFFTGDKDVETSQHRNLGLLAAEAGRKADGIVWDRLRAALDGWARQVIDTTIEFRAASGAAPWEDVDRTAAICIGGEVIGRVSVAPLACRLKMDERLKAWAFATAELNLSAAAAKLGRPAKLPQVPRFPQVELDFSVLADSKSRWEALRAKLGAYRHGLLRRVSFVESYEGGAIPAGQRSLTLRAQIGHGERTLTDDEIQSFVSDFKAHLSASGLTLRA